MNQDEKARRAQEAERLLQNPLLAEAFQLIRKSCYSRIEESSSDEAEIREDTYYFMRCLNVFESSLGKIIRDGKVETHIPPTIRTMRR